MTHIKPHQTGDYLCPRCERLGVKYLDRQCCTTCFRAEKVAYNNRRAETLAAAHADLSAGMPWSEIVKKYGIPQSTLRQRFSAAGMNTKIQTPGTKRGQSNAGRPVKTGWSESMANKYLSISL